MRQNGDRRYDYNRADKTVSTGKKTWSLKDVPPHVMYEWIREDMVFKGLFEDWLSDKIFWSKK